MDYQSMLRELNRQLQEQIRETRRAEERSETLQAELRRTSEMMELAARTIEKQNWYLVVALVMVLACTAILFLIIIGKF